MSDQAVNEILKRIDVLAAKLGVTAEIIWSILVKQAAIEAWRTGIGAVVVIGAACALLPWVYREIARSTAEHKKTECGGGFCFDFTGHWRGGFAGFMATTVACVVMLALLIAVVVDLASLPTLILNPEYWALQQILGGMR